MTQKTRQDRGELDLVAALHQQHPCGAVLINSELRIVRVTSGAVRMLGLGAGQTEDLPLEALPGSIQALVRETFASRRAVEGLGLDLRRPSEASIHLGIDVTPLLQEGKACAVVLVLNDLTAAARYDQRVHLLEHLASFGTMTATMAHEVKNALMVVKSFLDLVLENKTDAELAKVARREVARIDGIVGHTLRIANPSRPALSKIRLHDVLDQALLLVQPRAAAASILLNRSFQAAPDLIAGDDALLQQAFLNLFFNAFEALNPQGSLTVRTWTEPLRSEPGALRDAEWRPRLHISVEDNGCGIPPQAQARLFEPFFTTKPNGTGLGLAITRRIIQQHQGEISVESVPGQGTRFQIILPALR